MDTILLGQCPKVGSCEYCKEVPVFIKGWKFSQQQSDYHLLQNDPAPESDSVSNSRQY